MKKTSFFLLCLSALAFSTTSMAKQALDQTICVVNDDVITKSEFNTSMATIKMQLAQEHMPSPPPAVLNKQVLDQLINKKLQLQIAKQAGIEVKDKDLDQAIAHIAEQNNMSVTELYQRLNKEGISTANYRREMRDQMIMQNIQQQEIAGKLNVSHQEVMRFIESKRWQTASNKEYHLQDLLVILPDNPSANDINQAKKRAEQALAAAKQAKTFEALAQADAEHIQTGDLGWRKLSEIPSAFAETIANMKSKEIAGPIQTSNGFHILLLTEERALENQEAPTTQQVEQVLLQQKFEEAIRNWVSRLRSQAFIVTDPL